MGANNSKLVYGPYARLVTDAHTGRPRRVLTDEGRGVVADYYARYPGMHIVAHGTCPGLWAAARRVMQADELDELYHDVLIIAVIRYQPGRGASLRTVVCLTARRMLQAAYLKACTVRARAPASLTEEDEVLGAGDAAESETDCAHVLGLLRHLPERQGLIVRDRLGLNPARESLTFKALGARYGVTKQAAEQAYRTGVNRLRTALKIGRTRSPAARVLAVLGPEPRTARYIAAAAGVHVRVARLHLLDFKADGRAVVGRAGKNKVWALADTEHERI